MFEAQLLRLFASVKWVDCFAHPPQEVKPTHSQHPTKIANPT